MRTWARLGVVIDLDPLEGETGYEYVLRALDNRRVFIDGCTYFPEGTDDNDNLEFVEEDIYIPDKAQLMRIYQDKLED